MEQIEGILINVQVFNELQQYLTTKPYAEVAGFFSAFRQFPQLTAEQVKKAFKEDTEEETPE